jgi:sugar phosphate isomerase/epimerase
VDHEIGMCTATLLPDPLSATAEAVRTALDATAAAGFTHVSIWAAHLAVAGGRPGYEGGRAALDDLGLRVSMVEGSTSWVTGAPPQWGPSDEELVEAAAATGATHLLAACLDPPPIDLELAKRGLDNLVGVTAQAGVTVCLEFLPWSGVPDLTTAWRLAGAVDGASVLLDTFHWQRQPGGPDLDLLDRVDRIGAVQVCDAAATPADDTMTEAMTARLLPGVGVVDIGAILSRVDDVVVTAEIFNQDLIASEGAHEAARLMFQSCARL